VAITGGGISLKSNYQLIDLPDDHVLLLTRTPPEANSPVEANTVVIYTVEQEDRSLKYFNMGEYNNSAQTYGKRVFVTLQRVGGGSAAPTATGRILIFGDSP
jgi:hypothetical protein